MPQPSPDALRTEIESGPLALAPRHLTPDECQSLWTQAAKQAEAAAANAWLNYLLTPSAPHRAIYEDAAAKVAVITGDMARVLSVDKEPPA